MTQTLPGYVIMYDLMQEPSEEWVNYGSDWFGIRQISDHLSSFN